MNNQLKGAIYILLTMLILGCDRKEERHLSISINSDKSQIVKNQTENDAVGKKNLLKNPMSGLKRIELNHEKTSYIGTVEQPTIDGGVINDINEFVSAVEPPKIDNDVVEIPLVNDHLTTEKLGDHWKKARKVKSMLKNTAKEEKLAYVISESNKKGLPSSVAIIPIVESDYNDHAISPKGAGGPWQLMPELAKDYHMKDNERFDFKKSTEVALNHLKQLHDQFGNWDLTFAAYNAGSGRVENALRDNPNAQSINELHLPKETKEYVSRINSLNQVLSDL